MNKPEKITTRQYLSAMIKTLNADRMNRDMIGFAFEQKIDTIKYEEVLQDREVARET